MNTCEKQYAASKKESIAQIAVSKNNSTRIGVDLMWCWFP